MQPHDAYAPLRIPAFRRFLVGQTALTLGRQMQKVAVGWEIYQLTGSALHLGYAGLAQFLPVLALTFISGHVVDTFNRKTVLLLALSLTALSAAALAWNSAAGGPVPVVYSLLLLTGTANAFQNPARASLLPRIVPTHIFSNAASWSASGFEMASMAGPAIGGVLIAVSGSAALVYLCNAAAALIFIVALMGIRVEHRRPEQTRFHLESILTGIRFVWNTKTVLAAMALDMFAVLLGGATSLMPMFAEDILHVGVQGLGWLLAAPPVGAFTMAMIQAHRRPFARAGRALLWAVTGFGAATILFGFSTSFWLSMVALFFVGAFDNVSVVIRSTLIQTTTPDFMRGRVSALNSLFIGTSNELGGFESGLVAGFFGPVISVVSGGVGTIVVVLAAIRLWPELLTYERLGEDDRDKKSAR